MPKSGSPTIQKNIASFKKIGVPETKMGAQNCKSPVSESSEMSVCGILSNKYVSGEYCPNKGVSWEYCPNKYVSGEYCPNKGVWEYFHNKGVSVEYCPNKSVSGEYCPNKFVSGNIVPINLYLRILFQ